MFGQDIAATGNMVSVQVDVDDNDVGILRRFTSILGKACFACRALVFAGAFIKAH